MNFTLSARIITAITVIYGATIAAMAVLNAPGLGAVAIVGALVIGVSWTIRGLLTHRDDSQPGRSR